MTSGPSLTEHDDSADAQVAPSELTAFDRCDACGAQAYIRVELHSGSELLFCAHHGRKHEAQLRERAAHWHDETDRLHA